VAGDPCAQEAGKSWAHIRQQAREKSKGREWHEVGIVYIEAGRYMKEQRVHRENPESTKPIYK